LDRVDAFDLRLQVDHPNFDALDLGHFCPLSFWRSQPQLRACVRACISRQQF
jgi:hypothetical protein